MLHIPGLYIGYSEDRGRGVFVSESLSIGDLIEICPIIKIPTGQLKFIDCTEAYNYYFIWEESGYEACIALGYGSLYNHSLNPNAMVIMDYTDDTIKIECIQEVQPGTEILIDYRDGDLNLDLWFEAR
jgi:SET domain-containing protein